MDTRRDYRETGAVISGDVSVLLANHPEAFDATLFRSISGSEENSTEVTDVVGTLESAEVRLEYADPIPVRAMLVPDDSVMMGAFSDGTSDNPLDASGPVMLVLSEGVVPKQSVVRWLEYTGQGDDDVREVAVYIVQSAPSGASPIFGLIHYCIPLISAGETGE